MSWSMGIRGWKPAKLLGLSSVPCIRVDHLDETEQRLLRLAVNRLGEKGTWDLGELEAEFKELIIADAPIEISGFDADEVEQVTSASDEDGPETIDLAASTDRSSKVRKRVRRNDGGAVSRFSSD